MSRVPEVPYQPTMPVVVRRAAAEFGDDDFIVLLDRRISFRDAERASRRYPPLHQIYLRYIGPR